MTTVQRFSEYYLRRLWRVGDQDLEQDLPQLVKEAEARMSRDIRENSLVNSLTLIAAPEDDFFPLPADYNELISFSPDGVYPATLVSMEDLSRIRHVTPEGRTDVFAMQGNSLYVARGAHDMFLNGTLVYHMKVPPADMTNENAEMPFYDLHPDFFLAALDAQTYSYLREYELSQEKNTIYLSLVETMIRQGNYARWPSGALDPWMEQRKHRSTVFSATT